MDRITLGLILILSLAAFSGNAQTTNPPACSNAAFGNSNRVFASCNALSVLNSFLHWTYHPTNNTVDLAYRRTGLASSNWVVWSLNLRGSRMIGCQCLVAFRNSSGLVHAYTSPISSYDTRLQEGPLSFRVPRIAAEFNANNNEMIIYATLELPSGQTTFEHLWQNGPLSGDTPQTHSTRGDNVRAIGSVDFATGLTNSNGGGGSSRQRDRNIHGLLNAVSWGVLMPLGAVIARYLRVFKSTGASWFYLHVTCQTSAYIVGVAGWATGLKLGDESEGATQDTHRNIGITLFILGTLQVFALLLRPKPDHKYRFYWNIYHHVTGYSVIILSIINIFEGFELLGAQDSWRTVYMVVIICLGAAALLLEVFTWIIVLKRKRDESAGNKYPPHPTNDNGANGYGRSRSEHSV